MNKKLSKIFVFGMILTVISSNLLAKDYNENLYNDDLEGNVKNKQYYYTPEGPLVNFPKEIHDLVQKKIDENLEKKFEEKYSEVLNEIKLEIEKDLGEKFHQKMTIYVDNSMKKLLEEISVREQEIREKEQEIEKIQRFNEERTRTRNSLGINEELLKLQSSEEEEVQGFFNP